MLIGLAALLVTPREEDPQIVVPLADVMVSMPGYSAEQVEQLVATPLEKILYQIDGVEYVYSMSRENQAVITVRFYVGQDRERSLVKLYKKIDENQDVIPPGVAGWVVKPVEIDDVPVVTLTLTGDEGRELRACAGSARRWSSGSRPCRGCRGPTSSGASRGRCGSTSTPSGSRRTRSSPLEVQRAIQGANVTHPAGDFTRNDAVVRVEGGVAADRPEQLPELVVGVFQRPPGLPQGRGDRARRPRRGGELRAPRLGPGPGLRGARGFPGHRGRRRMTRPGGESRTGEPRHAPAVTLAIAKQKGTNAVSVAESVLRGGREAAHAT